MSQTRLGFIHRLSLAGVATLLMPFCVNGQTAYHRHIFFDNSRTPDRYFYSRGTVSAPSSLQLDNGKLPVETEQSFTPPNALRVKWKSAPGGYWEGAIEVERWRNREINFDGDTLSFWIFSPDALAGRLLPYIELRDMDSGFTAALSLDRFAPSLPANRWIRLNIPFRSFVTASIHPFNSKRLDTISVRQGLSDGVDHTILIDEMRIDSGGTTREASLEPPAGVTAKGYDRHIDLSWNPTRDRRIERCVVYRSFDDVHYTRIGIQPSYLSRYVDFVGKDNQKAYYRVTASDCSYDESHPSPRVSASTHPLSDDQLLTMVQEASFRYYWEGAHPEAGMTLENIPGDPRIVATGASGFGIMAIIVGVERGFITREQGIRRLLKIVHYLEKADRYHGVWPHFTDGSTGRTLPVFSKYDSGGDLVETSFLMEGLLAARQYFRGSGELERALYDKITRLWETVEFDWYRKSPNSDFLYWHWSPQYHWVINHPLVGFNETMIVYLLAIAAPKHGVPASLYYSGWANQSKDAGDAYVNGHTYYGIKLDVGLGTGGPLFFTHYSYMGFDPRGWRDRFTDYFENNRHIALINRAYCIDNPKKFKGYGERCWGLTAADGPKGYVPYEPDPKLDDGTMAPTGAISSFPYTPDHSMKALKYFYRQLGDRLWNVYGFQDAFNLTEDWFARIYMGLNQAPMAVMIENYRTGLIWKLFMSNPEIRPALQRIGFKPDAADAGNNASGR
jgi:hypothetical protein